MLPRKILTVKEAFARATALCDKCEQCSPDIFRKLDAWGLSAADRDKVIAELKRIRYLDDLRYVHAFAHDKMAYSGWGRYKIIQSLRAKRLDREYIYEACSELDPDEYRATALRIIKAKARTLEGGLSTYENRMKALRFGVGRGFEPSLIVGIINELKIGDDNP